MGDLAVLPTLEVPEVGALAVGRAGELRVASELLLRGFMPLMATVDTGVDIVLAHGPTIQVKTSSRPRVQPGGAKDYSFSFSSHTKTQRRPCRMEADFAVCWGIEDDLFWVIPAAAIGERTAISIPTSTKPDARGRMFDPFAGAWEGLR